MTGDAHNAFGTGPRSVGPEELALLLAGPEAAAAELARLTAAARDDAAVALASGRWVLGRPDPESHVPGDVVALRSFAVTGDLAQAGRHLDVATGAVPGVSHLAETAGRRLVRCLADTATLYGAVPHFIDTATAAGIVASQAPGPDVVGELRLPYPRIAVFLGRPLEVPVTFHDWPAAWDVHTDLDGQPSGLPSAVGGVRARGGGIDGVVLRERPGGGLADEVLWLVSSEPDPTRPAPMCFDRIRAVVWGRLSVAGLAPVATNLAAAVAWAEWREPERRLSLPDEVGSKAWRRAARRGEFRRHEPRGALAGVHVLDLARSPAAERPRSGESARPGVATHLRRAHWRLQPVGPGRAERRVVRVAATVVNAGGHHSGRTVYRVPTPESGPEPEPAGRPEPGPAPRPEPSAEAPPSEAVIDLRTVALPDPPTERLGAARPSPEHRHAQPEVSP